MLHNGHHPTSLRLKNGRFSSVFCLRLKCHAQESNLRPLGNMLRQYCLKVWRRAENRTYAPRVSCFANVDPNFVAEPGNRTHDTLVTMDVTLLFLGQFSSVIPLFGVGRKMLHNGHHPTSLRLKNGRFSSVFCLRLKCHAQESNLRPLGNMLRQYCLKVWRQGRESNLCP